MNTTDTPVPIRSARSVDVELATNLLTAGFAHDPVSAWLIPEPRDRAIVLRDYFRLFVLHGLTAGAVHLANDLAVAVWFPSTAPDATDLDNQVARFCREYAPRFTKFGQIMAAAHPAASAHDYLMLLATAPNHRNTGLGTALLAHRHHQLDQAGTPTYLEATTRRAATGIYHRTGYQPHGEPIQFPGGLTTYPLWRNPSTNAGPSRPT